MKYWEVVLFGMSKKYFLAGQEYWYQSISVFYGRKNKSAL